VPGSNTGGTPAPLLPTPPPTSAPTAAPTSGPAGAVLVVGPGKSYATLAAAAAASHDGDTIAVVSGTYTNDFAIVNTSITIEGVGGMVREIATVQPPNGKGFLVTNASITIKNFEFSGASVPSNNGAGIRGQGGDLNVQYCYFHDNQDGILATGNTSVEIDRSEFAHNGAGDGQSHNMYIGPVNTFTFTNSYSHDAIVGHELKSRAASTTITNDVIANGPMGTASYDIDIPNAGVAVIANNQIEKGPLASNHGMIHYGGETQYAWPTNSISISGNEFVNDLGPSVGAVYNQSAVNGLSVTAVLDSNTLWGFTAAQVVPLGLGDVRATNVLHASIAGATPINTAHPWASAPIIPVP
jgi:hypothetical protein